MTIKLENVSFKYENENVLENVSFSIKKNDFIAIIGPNGGGKTTLIKLIMGFIAPTKGKIKIKKEQIGYVPQHLKIDRQFPINVLDLVLTGSIAKSPWFGFFPKNLKEKARELLDKIELLDHQNSCFGSLSGGQMQKALIARALMSDPSILILDEPTANIDAESEKKILELLLENKNRTILMVTHHIETIVDKVKKIICVQKTVKSLLPKDICEHFALGLYHYPLLNTDKGHL
jgi:zinc transport system ATP-binding protein